MRLGIPAGQYARVTVSNVRATAADLFSQEFSYSTGYVATVLSGCLFAPSLLTFWFVNGIIDFSTAFAIGAVASPAGLQVRLVAYVLLIPTFLLLRMAIHLIHPGHRRQVLAGACPNSRYLSLDWFSVGILATGLPLALHNLGPWLTMNLILLVGVFGVPRFTSERTGTYVKLAAIVGATVLFLFANYGAGVPLLPHPATVVGPVATLALTDATTELLMRVVNSLLVGPFLIAGFGVVMNHVLTRPELQDVPLLDLTLPHRDPDRVVTTSAAIGTVFFLLVSGVATGRVIVLP